MKRFTVLSAKYLKHLAKYRAAPSSGPLCDRGWERAADPCRAAWPPLDRHTGLDHWTHDPHPPAALGACRMRHVGQHGPESMAQTPQIPAFVGCLHSPASPDTELEAGVGRQAVHLEDGDVIQGGFTPKAATRERQSSDSKQRLQWVPYRQHGAWGLSAEPQGGREASSRPQVEKPA